MRQRIQKLLAAHGVGSRRQVEAWIAAGRITVNGRPAGTGQAVTPADDIRLDGRRLRLARAEEKPHQGVAYHRPPQESLRPGTRDDDRSAIERLPSPGGRRWVPVSPLAPRDGGLEVFLTDGALAAALTRCASRVPCEFSVRVRGAADDASLARRLLGEAGRMSLAGRVGEVEVVGGEGSNCWLRFRGEGLRARDLRELVALAGLESNRVLRSQYGPVHMDRALARGRHRRLTDAELESLRAVAGLAPTGSRSRSR